tara:strand:- start:193 stop:477 length:285 start_codon:yes stop_codon:yes gene_type:complete
MSRSYPIWNDISSCAYKSSNKSYGVREHSEINVKVGTSRSYSYDLCTIKETKKIFGNWISYCVFVDDKKVKQAFFNNKTKVFTRRTPTEIKELI